MFCNLDFLHGEHMGVPLRPDSEALRALERRSFTRACAAIAAVARSKYPSEVLKQHWHGDDAAERVLKAVSNPTDTTNVWAATPSMILPALAPASVRRSQCAQCDE